MKGSGDRRADCQSLASILHHVLYVWIYLNGMELHEIAWTRNWNGSLTIHLFLIIKFDHVKATCLHLAVPLRKPDKCYSMNPLKRFITASLLWSDWIAKLTPDSQTQYLWCWPSMRLSWFQIYDTMTNDLAIIILEVYFKKCLSFNI